ncbi:3'(2'),5'-bisphosphate nucleotidase CysQ [Camelimonas abortus]|uniref:3'(2'),5'-bisphosphate nucleotidase CysQ n=1 Tax=Camelimonas abortus TaxID=1017184 RepID=A0ABV7LDT7_9HYPH
MTSTGPRDGAGAPTPDDALARRLADIALAAGRLVREMTARGVVASRKADGSACTDADVAAERLIFSRLAEAFPDIPRIGEETAPGFAGPPPERFFLVDPIDGTGEFVDGGDGYTVNVALVAHGVPVAGAIVAPARNRAWLGSAGGAATAEDVFGKAPQALAWRPVRTRAAPAGGLTALASSRHGDPDTEAWLARRNVSRRVNASSSLKFCLIAEGAADVYPRFGRTMAWDTAAGHAILQAAGGVVLTPGGAPLRYDNSRGDFSNGPFIAWGDPRAAGAV